MTVRTPNNFDNDFNENISRVEVIELRNQLACINKFQSKAEYALTGKILSVNDQFMKLTGYSSEDLADQEIGIFLDLHFRHSKEYVDFWKKMNNGVPISGAFKRIGKGFKTIWIQANYFPIMDTNGKPYKVIEYAHDISDYVFLKQNLTNAVEDIRSVVHAVKNNELTKRVPINGKTGEIAALCEDVNSMVDCMKSIIEMINKKSLLIKSAAQKVNAVSKALLDKNNK